MNSRSYHRTSAGAWSARIAIARVSLLLIAAGALSSARAADTDAQPAQDGVSPLRVGITPEYPPLVFRRPEGTNGVEIDLANALGKELGRPIQFVVLRRDQLIPALVDDSQIDIIMSGMSITKARQLKVAFSEPYLHNQLRAIFRQKDAANYKTAADVLKTTAKVGVIAGTTGEAFVSKNCPNAERVALTVRRDIPVMLVKVARMDVFIDDTFALAQMVAENEADVAYLQEPLSEEDLAWGVRQSDRELLADVNRALAKWKTDGTLDRVMDRWIPYLKKMKSTPASQPKA